MSRTSRAWSVSGRDRAGFDGARRAPAADSTDAARRARPSRWPDQQQGRGRLPEHARASSLVLVEGVVGVVERCSVGVRVSATGSPIRSPDLIRYLPRPGWMCPACQVGGAAQEVIRAASLSVSGVIRRSPSSSCRPCRRAAGSVAGGHAAGLGPIGLGGQGFEVVEGVGDLERHDAAVPAQAGDPVRALDQAGRDPQGPPQLVLDLHHVPPPRRRMRRRRRGWPTRPRSTAWRRRRRRRHRCRGRRCPATAPGCPGRRAVEGRSKIPRIAPSHSSPRVLTSCAGRRR